MNDLIWVTDSVRRLPFVDAEPVELVFRREPRNSDQLPLLTVNVHSRSALYGPVWLKTRLRARSDRPPHGPPMSQRLTA